MENFEVDLEKLKKEHEAAQDQKDLYGAIGGALDTMANAPTKADILLKRNPQRLDIAGQFKSMADGIQDPYERDSKQMDVLKRYREARLGQEQDAESKALKDPMSPKSSQYREFLKGQGFPVADNLSYADLQDQLKILTPKWEKDLAHKQKLEEIREQAKYKEKKEVDPLVQAIREQTLRDKERREQEAQDAFMTPEGPARTTDDAKKIKEGIEAKKEFDRKLDEMISLREKHGGGAILNREDVGRGKQLSKDLLLAYKDMAKLGVLSQADEAILNAIIPADPLQFNSPLDVVQGQDPTLHRLKKFRDDAQADFGTRLQTRLKNPPKPQKKIVKTQTNQKTGQKRVIYDDGTAEIVNPVAGR